MARVGDAADDIKGAIVSWADANDWDETLEHLHEIPRAIQEAFGQYADQLRDNTNLKDSIPDAVAEAASRMAGIADDLQQEIRFGAQRS